MPPWISGSCTLETAFRTTSVWDAGTIASKCLYRSTEERKLPVGFESHFQHFTMQRTSYSKFSFQFLTESNFDIFKEAEF